MRRFNLLLSATALMAMPMAASANGFESTIETPVTAPVKIEVSLSDDLAHRANNLPEKLRDRGNGSVRSLRAGFTANGYYGDKALENLVEEIEEELTEDLTDRGITVSDEAQTVLRVTLEDVRNNRPTFEQLARQPSLSMQSFALGGAELTGELIDASGESLGTVEYEWFDRAFNDIAFAQASGVWTDANRAISRFSKRTAKAMS